jgi:hypothetical protein
VITRGDLVRRAWRARADVGRRLGRRGSATTAVRSFGRHPRADSMSWFEATSSGIDTYRAVHPPIADRVAVVCVSRRPELVADVIANVGRQADELAVEFVFVTNDDGFDGVALAERLAGLPNATLVEMPPSATLGACLNAGLQATSERFVAKFDDDDWYGRNYLVDALRAHGYAGAGVVGKHTYYADVGEPPARYLRFPGREFSYSGTLAGGTLVIDRQRTGDLLFDDVSIGEDRRFLAACHRRGVSTFSSERFGFVQRRNDRNTWSLPNDQFLVGCLEVAPTDPLHDVDR